MDQQLLDFTVKVIFAAILGFIIGFQREKYGKPAGSRTYALVALGSAVFTILSFSGFAGPLVDTTRIAANIVVGIGFLGAGIIIFHDDKVIGLTTAAGIWVTAALGMLVGVGRYIEALILTAIVLIVLFTAALEKHSFWKK